MMLNLLISSDPSAWESNLFYFPRERCLTEYITNELRSRFSALGVEEIRELIKMPSIFAYERYNHKDAFVGKIKGISVRQQKVKIDYVLSGERISFEDFVNLESQFDLSGWELDRTHWTVKKVDIAEIRPYYSSNKGHKPTVFISYSWTPPRNQKSVFRLIDKLMADNISVIYDKKDLQPGQDKDYFMEQALTNHKIDKILVICNRDYAEKANNRQGGVGYESEIIISQISSKPMQTKFIPVVMETDKNGKAYLPTFIVSRKYVDLTIESGYDELLTAIRTNGEEKK